MENQTPENRETDNRKTEILRPLRNLREKLFDAKHPYGLLLMSTPFLSASGMSENVTLVAPDLEGVSSLASSSSIAAETFSDITPGTTGKLFKDVTSAISVGASSSTESPAVALSSSASALFSQMNEGDDIHLPVAGISSLLGLSVHSNPDLAGVVQQTFLNNVAPAETALGGLLISARKEETLNTTQERIKIDKETIQVGSVQAKVFQYMGQRDYVVAPSNREEDGHTIRQGDKILIIHVNQNHETYSKMDNFTRMRAIMGDFNELSRLLENPADNTTLSPEEIAVLENLKNSPMLGVSHLVEMISRKGLPVWDISILPKAVQLLHKLDSKIVSKMFGGTRDITAKDIKVMFITPEMRRSL